MTKSRACPVASVSGCLDDRNIGFNFCANLFYLSVTSFGLSTKIVDVDGIWQKMTLRVE